MFLSGMVFLWSMFCAMSLCIADQVMGILYIDYDSCISENIDNLPILHTGYSCGWNNKMLLRHFHGYTRNYAGKLGLNMSAESVTKEDIECGVSIISKIIENKFRKVPFLQDIEMHVSELIKCIIGHKPWSLYQATLSALSKIHGSGGSIEIPYDLDFVDMVDVTKTMDSPIKFSAASPGLLLAIIGDKQLLEKMLLAEKQGDYKVLTYCMSCLPDNIKKLLIF